MRAFALVLLLALGACVESPSPRARPRADARPAETPKTGDPFDDALLRIFSYDERAGTAFGNTPSGYAMARRFNEILTAMEKIAFTGGAPEGRLSLTQENFLTYCEHREGKVAFLVHVPRLKSYRGEARDVLLKIAWTAASGIVEETCPECRLGVGLRGSLLFGAIAIGDVGSESPSMETAMAVSDARLRELFTGPVPESAAAGGAEVALLTRALEVGSERQRLEALRRLGEHEGDVSEAVPVMVRLLETDPSKEVRVEILHVLAAKEGERAVAPLERALVLGQWYATMQAAAEGLVQCGTPGRDALLRQYRSSGWARHHILTAVASLGEGARDHLPLLREAAASENNPRVAISALGTLGALRDVDSVPVMISALDHTSPAVRAAAIQSLASLGPEAATAVETLVRLRERTEGYEERSEVSRALEAIRGEADRPEPES